MEENNLNLVPTEQELINAGFEQSRRTGIDYYYFSYSKKINDNLIIIVEGSDTGIWYKNENKAKLIHPIEATKAAINKEFEHFNQPLPQWEKPRQKVGEVWGNGGTVYLINDNVLIISIRVTIIEDDELDTGTIISISPDILTKLANSLEEYYRQKFLKEGVTSMLYEAKKETTETATLENFKPTTINPKSQVEKAHEYSWGRIKSKRQETLDRELDF